MSGTLTRYLQQQFQEHCPHGWQCRAEEHLLGKGLERMLGYAPQVDVVMEREDGSSRLWIEFEISRADPVANHAKYATSHLYAPKTEADVFVAMISSHVDRGRRNLAASTVRLMRHIGISAFQTHLLPQLPAEEIKLLNHTDSGILHNHPLPIKTEINRAIDASSPAFICKSHRIHFAWDCSEVLLNASGWNTEIALSENKRLWGKRTCQYFVHDPVSGSFAPSKYCAYIPVSACAAGGSNNYDWSMTIPFYCMLDESEPRFDGHIARKHLEKNLLFTKIDPAKTPSIANLFDSWIEKHKDAVTVRSGEPVIMTPPAWW